MNAYTLAKERYAALGVDTEAVLETLKNVTVSVHCWQGDDVVGFDAKEALSGGIQTTKKSSICTQATPFSKPVSLLTATPFSRSIFPAGSPMPKSAALASTLTRRSSLIPWSRTD